MDHPTPSLLAAYLDLLQERFGQLDAAVADLPNPALDWVPGTEMNSLAVLVTHVCGSARYWIGEVAGGTPVHRDRAAEFQARGLSEAHLRAQLADTLAWAREAVSRLEDADWGAPRQAGYREHPVTVGWALLHALEHSALHLGHAQLTRQLWEQRG